VQIDQLERHDVHMIGARHPGIEPDPTRGLQRLVVVAALLIGAALSGCSSSSSGVVRTLTPPSTTSASPSSASATPSTSAASKVKPKVIITPATGLHDRQVVTVTASGFSPDEALQVIECADKGTSTGPADCNLTGMQSATSDAAGRVNTQLTVLRGPFGGNNHVCNAQQRCLISVTQASLTPTDEADGVIQFAAG
jgi:hypothetical protein